MPLGFRLADYDRYRAKVGEATVIDLTRRTDPARVDGVWRNLQQVLDTYGPPWVLHLWTKNVGGTLEQGADILQSVQAAGTTLAAQVTVTGLAGTVWEPLVPTDSLDQLPRLAEVLGGPGHIKWRYDPIIPGVHTSERFARLAARAASHGLTRSIINFVAVPGRYKRADRRLAGLLPGWAEGMPGYDDAWRIAVALELVDIAAQHGISLACCAESSRLSAAVQGLGVAACADHAWFCELSGKAPARTTYGGSRPGCGCVRYFDVGNYGYWRRCHQCAYCYAG